MLFVTLLPRILNFVDTAGIGKELNSFAQWERDRYLPGASCAHGRLEVWNLLATRCSPLWTEFFERDDPIKISGFGKKYANRGPALNYLKLPRENSMPSNSFLSFFFHLLIFYTRPFTEIRRGTLFVFPHFEYSASFLRPRFARFPHRSWW